jgi:hypothetical protein
MQADVDVEGAAVERLEVGGRQVDVGQHLEPRPHGSQDRAFGLVGTEQGHDAVTHVAGDDAGVALDARRDLVEVALQHVDDVVGQQRLGEAREAADVGEEDADRQLLADRAGTALGSAAPAAAQAAAHHRLGMTAPA